MKVGPNFLSKDRIEFTVWSPFAEEIQLKIVHPKSRLLPMSRNEGYYWKTIVEGIEPQTKYFFRINNQTDRPDPASNYQPDDVHSASMIVDHNSFIWKDSEWKGIPLQKYIIYELHIGTFTEEGTFEAAISHLDDLKDVGITAIEIMPVAQFPGTRNWGYDGVYPYAPQNSYGGVDGLKMFVEACHLKSIAVILDVVYNHFGPAGNYLSEYGPYFFNRYQTPWGQAVNFDGEYCDGVRNYFIENALYWYSKFHVDALRLDAVHSIYDFSAKHFLAELSETIKQYAQEHSRKLYVIVESDLNDVRLISPGELGGYGCDAQWMDDFHHAVHSLITNETTGYYSDFGKVGDLAEAIRNSFVYAGKYSAYRKRRHGNSAVGRPTYQFVSFIQNHDQIGNRANGERLSVLVPFEALKLAAGVLLLSPYLPMLFMGEEYGETAPFQYFVSHSDVELVEAIRAGRKDEFKEFNWGVQIPDPQAEETFQRSKLNWDLRKKEKNNILLEFYKSLIKLRKSRDVFNTPDRNSMEVISLEREKIILFKRWKEDDCILLIMNFNSKESEFELIPSDGNWKKLLDSAAPEWGGLEVLSPERLDKEVSIKINGFSFTLYEKEAL